MSLRRMLGRVVTPQYHSVYRTKHGMWLCHRHGCTFVGELIDALGHAVQMQWRQDVYTTEDA